MSQTPIVQIQNLKKKIGNKTIIHGLTFDIYKGEVFGFLGPNGAGKTTTIRMMVGLMGITEGKVLIKGNDISKNFKEAISHIGAIVENPEMYKFLSGYKNLIHYSRMVKGVTKERIKEVVKLVGLEDAIHNKVKTYSLGMRQRLGIAQALLHSPSVLILDEPTNGLDPAGIREIRHYLRKLAQEEGLAVIVSSHLLAEMELMCDRIGILQNGQLIGVQNITEFVSGEEQKTVRFHVEPVEKAQRIFAAKLNDGVITTGEDYIDVLMEKEAIPDIVIDLVEEGIKIYGISEMTKTLEEKFLEVTGGKQVG
ncbi:ABC transporter ATP-binding protein [Fictibacillus gelatini]|uniref:ABC transporter ATP-binding protein n=1 Tax=Fictibacillus gelatini TaxID=225985 RepID=UPI0003FDEDE1|nr:ABC transporter ATP-binding protein [Fictibacillus gelatini]